MTIFNGLALLGGLCLFLFGMNVMGSSLERRAGDGLRSLLGRLTTRRWMGFLTGLAVTAVIQSSSATTVMVVGFVNSGLMTLRQAINVIMGANVGTTVTSWLLSLTGIQGDNLFVQLLKPTSFTPVLALIGISLSMFCKSSKKKDTGNILLGFATLMFGMEAMSGAVSGLSELPEFRNLMLLFTNPVLGVLVGALLTAIIQSSSASVGILQALAITGQVSVGAAVPIIMGQNIGTCVTALISSVGANKNAKRAAAVHLLFNIIGTAILLTVFCLAKEIFAPPIINDNIDAFGIAVVHTVFNLLCTAIMLPAVGLLERLAIKFIPDAKIKETASELDERLLATPALAIERCRVLTEAMAVTSVRAMKEAMSCIHAYTPALEASVREKEEKSDHYEDILGSYLVKVSGSDLSARDSAEAAKLLRMIGDFERISDHAVNLLESAEEIRTKKILLSAQAQQELQVMVGAVNEILDLSLCAFLNNDLKSAALVEPLEQVVDTLKEQLRTRHILRLQKGECTIGAGFVWADLLTNLERAADHCSNIAGCVIEMAHASLDLHEYLHGIRAGSPDYVRRYDAFANKYALVQAGGQTE